ncbi:MAG: glycosyltransferase [Desulfovibrio sp.]|nr:glycosyltransferase [Desulfovibrio sp.]
MTPQISIIIPVFNAARWLNRCLASVCGQEFSDVEILCINDASTDASLDILHDHARRDRRIVVADLSRNLGVSTARNIGIAMARGKYLGFVDSDDSIEKNFYAELHREAASHDLDMAEAPVHFVDEDGKTCRSLDWSWFCSSLFNADFLAKNALTFPPKFSHGEDLIFMARVRLAQPHGKKIYGTSYQYFQIQTSASHRLSHEQCSELLKAYRFLFNEIEQRCSGDHIATGLAEQVFNTFFFHLLSRVNYHFPDATRRDAAKLLLDLQENFPYFASARAKLARTDPQLLSLLQSGDPEALTNFLVQKKRHLSQELRSRIVRRLSSAISENAS